MEVVWSLFSIIATVITDILYDKALINNLFSFDLDKKVVEIKKKKNNSKNSNQEILDDTPQIYSPIKNIKKSIKSNIQGELSVQSRNKLNDDILNNKEKPLTLKRRKKKKLKHKNTIGSPVSQNISINKKNGEEDNLKGIYKSNIFNKDKITNMQSEMKMVDNKETDKGSDNRRIIDRIKMKCCCVYFWFCFARKKKNIQNVLLDEGMRIIEEKLDIINIFKKIYSIDSIEKTLKIKGIALEMSDTCKQKLKLYT